MFQQLKKKIEEIEIENLREGVVKISNSEPNVPLSEIRNSTLQQHLNRFLSDLRTIRFIFLILGHCKNWMKKGIPMKTQYPSLSMKEYDNLLRAHTTSAEKTSAEDV
ncbi:hypothetical protein KY290_013612 [Solanum tuberosum]|uniref:Uncharacterized protein n=1 Tax=Solanum tuberosum TaxID=4113 RepID=A0ABQ7VM94_SOLTU|nr:hypothetical protein KY289_013739 [Solanum tuberosum]KAH0769631.1 hypothetical protein KY290_013612 [Solanum tuberosum]